MKLTKFEHACTLVEHDGRSLVIDPGEFSPLFNPNNTPIDIIVVTHAHGDHIDPTKLEQILAKNPNVAIYSTEIVANQHPNLPVTIVEPGDVINTDNFDIRFTGSKHALVTKALPDMPNIGVLVNHAVYYPGDSFSLPEEHVHTLLVPASGPWMKIGESVEFIEKISPKKVIPTHDALLSDVGKRVHDLWLQNATEAIGSTYTRLAPGESIDL